VIVKHTFYFIGPTYRKNFRLAVVADHVVFDFTGYCSVESVFNKPLFKGKLQAAIGITFRAMVVERQRFYGKKFICHKANILNNF